MTITLAQARTIAHGAIEQGFVPLTVAVLDTLAETGAED
jgi:hypothetical protein